MSSKLTFESAMSKLEDELRRLEGGNMTLEESLGAFENAVKLVKICNEKLENAERKVRLLTEGDDGVLTDVPFPQNDNEA